MPDDIAAQNSAAAPQRKTVAKRKVGETENLEEQLSAHRAKGAQPASKLRNTTNSPGTVMAVFVVPGIKNADLEDDDDGEAMTLSSGGTAVVVAKDQQNAGEILFTEFYPSSAQPEDEVVGQALSARVTEWLKGAVELNLEREGFFDLTNGVTYAVKTASLETSADARIRKKKFRLFITKNFKTQSMVPSAAVVLAESEKAAQKMILKHVEKEGAMMDARPPRLVQEKWLGDEGELVEIQVSEAGFYNLDNGTFYSEE